MSKGSIMPNYAHLLRSELDFSVVQGRVDTMAMLGVPYGSASLSRAEALAREQASAIARDLVQQEGIRDPERKQRKQQQWQTKQVVAVIAYLQRLGRDIQLASAKAIGDGQSSYATSADRREAGNAPARQSERQPVRSSER
jgi:cytochrome c oxidase cbb3-type subunit I/II